MVFSTVALAISQLSDSVREAVVTLSGIVEACDLPTYAMKLGSRCLPVFGLSWQPPNVHRHPRRSSWVIWSLVCLGSKRSASSNLAHSYGGTETCLHDSILENWIEIWSLKVRDIAPRVGHSAWRSEHKTVKFLSSHHQSLLWVKASKDPIK